METALVTGMLETEFLPVKQAKKDVKNSETGSFNEILELSLKEKDVTKNEEVKENEVEKKGESNNEEVEIADESESAIDNEEGKNNKKDKKVKKDELVFDTQLVDVIRKDVELKSEDVVLENKDVVKLIENVENGEAKITPEEKLNNLLSKLDVEFNEEVNIKDESEKVIKVGPQSVETEKIKFNIEDVESGLSKEELNVEKLDSEMSSELEQVSVTLELNEKDVEEKVVLTKDVARGGTLNEKVVEENNKDNDMVEMHSNEFDRGDLQQKNFNEERSSEGELNKKEEGLNKKEEKIKVKDFRIKKDVEVTDKLIVEKDVKIDNKFEIKEVNNIGKFENLNFEQDVLDQVTEKLEVSLFDNKSEMVIKLKPYDLGKVTVKISIENGVMNAKFLADSVKVKEALESNMNNLKESLKEQGLNVQDLNVSVDTGRSQNHNFEQNNLVYFNNKKDYRTKTVVGYGNDYYDVSENDRKVNDYFMDSTVSFLA